MLLNMYLCEKRERSQHGRLSQHHGLRKGHVDAFFRNTIKLFNSATLSQADCFTLITQRSSFAVLINTVLLCCVSVPFCCCCSVWCWMGGGAGALGACSICWLGRALVVPMTSKTSTSECDRLQHGEQHRSPCTHLHQELLQ